MLLYLVRHGQSYGNIHFVPGAIRPKTDPLTDLGHTQAAQAAAYLNDQRIKPTLILSSPYTRALDTATTIQKVLEIPLIEDDRLREYNPGDWDGTHIDEFTKRFEQLPADERYTFHPPNGESWLDEAMRFNAVIEQAENDGHACVVLVSHLDPIRAAVNQLTEQSPKLWSTLADYPPGSVTTLHKLPTGWIIL